MATGNQHNVSSKRRLWHPIGLVRLGYGKVVKWSFNIDWNGNTYKPWDIMECISSYSSWRISSRANMCIFTFIYIHGGSWINIQGFWVCPGLHIYAYVFRELFVVWRIQYMFIQLYKSSTLWTYSPYSIHNKNICANSKLARSDHQLCMVSFQVLIGVCCFRPFRWTPPVVAVHTWFAWDLKRKLPREEICGWR